MKNQFSLSVLLSILFLVGCQKNEIPQTSLASDNGSAVVQAADGTMYSVDCLRSNASTIRAQGSSAMNDCAVNLSADASDIDVSRRGKFFSSNYAWVYYPPTYNSGNYYNPYYYNNGSYTNTYNYSYNPYYDTNYSNNSFCAFAFGGGTSFNCYYLFGYTSPSYQNYYNSDCSYCLYVKHATKCRNRCWNQVYVNR